ncbi:MAG: hypothetical protein K9J81_02365 [Desulfohalobiaceae bacterium]|nr:hypothetical protein [Desulfohalobiaceae bacterium]
MPVEQSTQSVLLDEKRIAGRSVLSRVRCHSTSKKHYSDQKKITKSVFLKNIATLADIFKRIVWAPTRALVKKYMTETGSTWIETLADSKADRTKDVKEIRTQYGLQE